MEKQSSYRKNKLRYLKAGNTRWLKKFVSSVLNLYLFLSEAKLS